MAPHFLHRASRSVSRAGDDLHSAWWAADLAGRARAEGERRAVILSPELDEELAFSDASTQS